MVDWRFKRQTRTISFIGGDYVKFLFDVARWELGADTKLIITIPKYQNHLVDRINKTLLKNGQKEIEIKKIRESRSLDANAALWVMLNKMAIKLHTTKDELYLDMLERYGVFTHIVVKPVAVKRVMTEWRTVRELGKVEIGGKTGVQLQCFYGSSQYSKEEFSVLLNGVIEEAKEIGVEFISKEDVARMIAEWSN